MAEYARTSKHQFVDSEIVMVIDTVTGEPCRFSHGNACGKFEDALAYAKKGGRGIGFETRMAIVKMPCVIAFEL